MQTVADLGDQAEAHLLAGRFREALHAYVAILRLQPANLDARLRVADALLALGEVQQAAVAYTALARYAAHAGHPLHALVALKVLTTLEPLLTELLADLATLYARDSDRLGRGARPRAGEPGAALPAGFALGGPSLGLVEEAATLAQQVPRVPLPQKLPPVPLFSELPEDAFARVITAIQLVRARPGDAIVTQGDPGDSFFVLARGEVRVERSVPDGPIQRLATLGGGAIFGEMALVSASPRSATVVAERATDLLRFDGEALGAAAQEVKTIAAALDRFTRGRMLTNLLNNSPLFRPLTAKQRADLIRRFSAHDVPAGTTIVEEGAVGQGLYVVLSGAVEIHMLEAGLVVLLATLGPGEIFGEISLLHEERASAT
ncbi:MAG: cyclic nucleotide-binding domain-containing protein, partial [Sandaracinaceae bacterium]